MFNSKSTGKLLAIVLFSSLQALASNASVSYNTSAWFSVGNSTFDPTADAQTGDPRAELVGDGTNPGLYFAYDNPNNTLNDPNSRLLFRVRVASYTVSSSALGFGSAVFIGIDVGIDGNYDGKIDIFVAADDRGTDATNGVSLYFPTCPQSGACNTGPSTTNLSSKLQLSNTSGHITNAFVTTGPTANANWAPVSSTTDPRPNLDTDVSSPSDKTSYQVVDGFFSFAIDMGAISRNLPGFDANSGMRVIALTSQQPNALNQDLGGCDGNAKGLTWNCGLSSPFTPMQYAPTPEPATFGTAVAALLGTIAAIRKRKA